LSAEEYKRLKSLDTREAFYTNNLPGDIVAEFDKGFQGEPTPDLEHLTK
jgi:hypothetical protein